MTAQNDMFWFTFPVAVIIAFIGFITPFLLREDIVFGSRYPNELIHRLETGKLKKNFKLIYLSIYIPLLILFGFIMYTSRSIIYFNYGIIGEIIIYISIYAVFNGRSKLLKKELLTREKIRPQKEILTVDTDFRKEKFLISIRWFLPSLLIIISNALILIFFYNKIPGEIATHYSLAGTASQFTDKTYFHVLTAPLTSLIILCTFIMIYYSIKVARQEIDSNKPETSKLKDRHFRLLWSEFAVIICTGIVMWLFVVSLTADKLVVIPHNIFETFFISFTFLILLYSVILGIKTGQSGSRLKLKINEPETGINNIDDDSNWKLGMIYFNPRDPAIFVAKRCGIGWTVNMGRPAVIVIAISLIVFLIITKIISK